MADETVNDAEGLINELEGTEMTELEESDLDSVAGGETTDANLGCNCFCDSSSIE